MLTDEEKAAMNSRLIAINQECEALNSELKGIKEVRESHFIKKEALRNLNIKSKNNLFISLATCYGGHLLKIYKPWETCPFFGYIGPSELVYNLDLEASYSAFFETLLTENDFSKAIEKLQNTWKFFIRNGGGILQRQK